MAHDVLCDERHGTAARVRPRIGVGRGVHGFGGLAMGILDYGYFKFHYIGDGCVGIAPGQASIYQISGEKNLGGRRLGRCHWAECFTWNYHVYPSE